MATAAKQIVPSTIDEAIAAWDAGDEVQTVEMGGMGVGYELAIQTVAFELMRALRDDPRLAQLSADTPDNEKFPDEFSDRLDAVVTRCNREMDYGLSGAQAGAAKNIAINLTRCGYENARAKAADRLIFVRKPAPVEQVSA